jgi:hypothetical protein
MNELSSAAVLARKSLEAHPRLDTPQAIADGPLSIEELGPQDIRRGLRELEALGLVREGGGRWRLVG